MLCGSLLILLLTQLRARVSAPAEDTQPATA
jgi:hypothetical protein